MDVFDSKDLLKEISKHLDVEDRSQMRKVNRNISESIARPTKVEADLVRLQKIIDEILTFTKQKHRANLIITLLKATYKNGKAGSFEDFIQFLIKHKDKIGVFDHKILVKLVGYNDRHYKHDKEKLRKLPDFTKEENLKELILCYRYGLENGLNVPEFIIRSKEEISGFEKLLLI